MSSVGASRSVLSSHERAGLSSLSEEVFGDENRKKRFVRQDTSRRWLISDHLSKVLPEGFRPSGIRDQFVHVETGELRRQEVKLPRPAMCGSPIGQTVTVNQRADHAHYGAIARCQSVWACPRCAAPIRQERAREISRIVEAHKAAGGTVVFVTLTLRHTAEQPLLQLIETATGGWRELFKNRPGERLKRIHAVAGYVRSIDITYGRHGWHPHVHALLFLDSDPNDDRLRKFGDALHARWSDYAYRHTGKTPTREHGIDVQRVDDEGKVLGSYLTKIQGRETSKSWSAGAELARSDLKTGHGSLTPFELLDANQIPKAQARRLWVEYYNATYHKRAITWDRQLKHRYGLIEKSEEDILDDAEAEPEQWLTHRLTYMLVRNSNMVRLADALDAAEGDRWDLVHDILPGIPICRDSPPGQTSLCAQQLKVKS